MDLRLSSRTKPMPCPYRDVSQPALEASFRNLPHVTKGRTWRIAIEVGAAGRLPRSGNCNDRQSQTKWLRAVSPRGHAADREHPSGGLGTGPDRGSPERRTF